VWWRQWSAQLRPGVNNEHEVQDSRVPREGTRNAAQAVECQLARPDKHQTHALLNPPHALYVPNERTEMDHRWCRQPRAKTVSAKTEVPNPNARLSAHSPSGRREHRVPTLNRCSQSRSMTRCLRPQQYVLPCTPRSPPKPHPRSTQANAIAPSWPVDPQNCTTLSDAESKTTDPGLSNTYCTQP
jgi:hypothetical protein